jgi:hypothetical protein
LERGLRLEGPQLRRPRFGEAVCSLLFVVGRPVEGDHGDIRGDPRLRELARHGSAGFPTIPHPALDDGPRERFVVDQTDTLEPDELGGDLVAIEACLDEPALELPAAALPHR